jgi:hypothetical protein
VFPEDNAQACAMPQNTLVIPEVSAPLPMSLAVITTVFAVLTVPSTALMLSPLHMTAPALVTIHVNPLPAETESTPV